jgi:tRNA(adenine34) deaminase
MFSEQDYFYMRRAIELAQIAEKNQEVPVGAVLVHENKIIGDGFNQPISSNDPTAHAEIIALRNGATYLNNYRLIETTLYVTLEPCMMCMGALIHSRVKRLVFGAHDEKTGAVESVFQMGCTDKLNHRIECLGGILAKECGSLLSDFFRRRRRQSEIEAVNARP